MDDYGVPDFFSSESGDALADLHGKAVRPSLEVAYGIRRAIDSKGSIVLWFKNAAHSFVSTMKMRNAFRGNTFLIMGRFLHSWRPIENTFNPSQDQRKRSGRLFGACGKQQVFRKKK